MDQAENVRDLADDDAEVGDTFVSLCVLAGIAAADVLCCVSLGEHAQGESHDDAVQLLRRVQPSGADLAKSLRALLTIKTKAAYSERAVTAEDRKRAGRSAARLVDAARDRA
jgi:hypothetical protein